jgi:hypothetical protein
MSEQDQTVELALLRKDLELLQSDMAEVKGDLKKLADAWSTAENLVAFIKWLAGLAAGITLLVAFFKGFLIPTKE